MKRELQRIKVEFQTMMDNLIRVQEYRRNISIDSDTDMSGDEFSETFQDVLYRAAREDRLVRGIYQSAHVLEICPDMVELCILPNANNNIANHIQQKLIQAFCLENDIRIVELVNADFAYLIAPTRSKSADMSDMGCVLVTTKPVDTKYAQEDNENEQYG